MNTNYSLTEGNRENEGCRFLAGSRILCFIRCLLFASSRQSNSSPPSCALVSISGFDFVNLCRKTRLRGIAARRPAYRGTEQILNVKISTPILPCNFYAAILQPLSLTAAAILNPQLLCPRQRVEIYVAACKNDAGAFSDKGDLILNDRRVGNGR